MKKILLLSVVALMASIITYSQQKGVVWSEDFEGDWTVNWHVEAGTWEVGTPTSGPGKAYAGSKCAATVLAGNYVANVSTRLIRHTSFVVPSADQNPRLRYWHWYNIADGDQAMVQIKVGTGEWQTISEIYTNTSSNVWTYPMIDLKPFAGSTVQLALYFSSNNNIYVSSGWYVDNMEIITGSFIINDPETWESGLGDWYADKGTWEVGVPASGPNKAFSGTQCAATVLNSSYHANVSSRLISPSFTIAGADMNPRLRFWHWYNIADGDQAMVQIKVGTGEWQTISEVYTNTSSNVWTYPMIDLKPFAGSTVQLALYFISNSNIYLSSGWYVDDIEIVHGAIVFNNPENWESGLGDWYADKGTWEVGSPSSGPNKAYGGTQCAATVLNGAYHANVNSRLISPSFTIPGVDQNPRIRFWHWYQMADGDEASIQIKTETGEWQTIAGPFINSSGGVWTPGFVDLSSYANQKARLALKIMSNSNIYVNSGWYVDDISFDNITWVKENEFRKVNIYPNPFSEKTTIQFDDTDQSGYRLSVYSISGTKVMEMKDIRSNKIELEKGSLPAGIYIIELKGSKIYRNKIIIR